MGRIEGELDGTAGGPVARVHRKRDAREPRGRLRPCHRRRARVRRRAGDRRVLRRVPNPEHPATPPRRGGLVHGDDPRLLGILRDAVATRGPPDAPRGLGAGARRPRRDGAARHRHGAVARDGDRARHRGGPRAGGARGAPHARDVPVCRLGRARSARRRRTERTGAVLRPGSISSLYYADRVMEFPLGVFGIALASASLPVMARQAAARETRAVADTLNFSLRLAAYIALPAMAGLVVLRAPIVRVLFERGKFGPAETAATADALAWYAIGLAVLVWPGSRSLLVDVLWLGGTIAGAVGLFWSASVVLDLPERTALLRMLPRAEPRSSPGA